MANSDKDIKITPNTGQSDSPKIEVTGADNATKTLTINDDGSITFDSDLTVQGNFTVSGTTTTFDTDTLNVQDNIITVNEGETGAGVTAGTAGIEVDRGTATNATILYDESIDGFVVDSKGTGRTAKFVNQNGYIELGPQNTSYAHITTDRARFYFNRDLVIGENAISSYNGDFSIRRSQDSSEQIVIGDNSMTFTSAGNDVVTVDGTNARFGIGEATPDNKLHVNSGTSNGVAKFESTDNMASIAIADNDTTIYVVSETDYGSFGGTNDLATTNLNIHKTTGYVGIGTTAPVSPLHIDHNVSNPSTDAPNSFGIYIDADLAGSTATGGDREQGGIYVDLDSSATGGDASDEHRPYGVWADVRINSESDADSVVGIYGYSEAQRSGATAATTFSVRGGYFFAGSDETSDHTVSELTGALGYASVQDAGTVTTTQALRGYTNVNSSRSTNVGTLRGVSAEVDISGGRTDGSDITTGDSAVFRALLDHNPAASGEGTVTITDSYLYYGTTSITDSSQVTNNYGLYLSGEDKNYFSGKVGIGTTSPEYELDVGGSFRILPTISSNAGTAIRIGANGNSNDITLLRIDGSGTQDQGESDSGHYGFSMKYMGSGSAENNRYAMFMDNNQGTAIEAMSILQDGKVGIGVSAPTDTLAVSGGIKIGEFNSTDGTGYAGSSPPSDHNNATGASDPQIRVAGRTSDQPGIIQMAFFDANNFFGGTGEFTLGRLQYAMNENSNTVTTVAEVRGVTSDPNTAGDFDGALAFLTSQGDGSGANLTEKMRLTSDGYLGIGTDSPSTPLHIKSTTTTLDNLLTLENNGASGVPGVGIKMLSNVGSINYLEILHDAFGATNFKTVNGASTYNKQMHLQSDGDVSFEAGNVGIGTSSPSTALEVSGTLTVGNAALESNQFRINNTGGYAQIELGGSSGAFIDMKNPFSDDFDARLITDGNGLDLIMSGAGKDIRLMTNGTQRVKVEDTLTTVNTNLLITNTLPQLQIIDSDATNSPTVKIYNNNGNMSLRADSENVGTGGAIEFTTSGTERMRLTDAGNLGIGTTSPQSKLHVSSGTSGDAVLILEADTDNNNEADQPYIVFEQDGGVQHSAIGSHSGENTDNNALIISNSVNSNGIQAGIVFKTGSTTSGYANATESMRIYPQGETQARKTRIEAVSSNTTLGDDDSGKTIYWTGGTLTLPATAQSGQQFVIINNTGASATPSLGTSNSIATGWSAHAAMDEATARTYIAVAANTWIYIG